MGQLIVVFHDNFETSNVNQKLVQVLREQGKNVHLVGPNFIVDEEQSLLMQYDEIILQYPIQWFYGPSTLKSWFDKVFAYGFAYGDRFALEGKTFRLAVSFGGTSEAYKEAGANGITVSDVLKPVARSLTYVKAISDPEPFIVFDVFSLTDERLKEVQKEYLAWIH